MLSVILYGRNDSYGYNLHKRAAISLNCIAEMLSGEHDEIIFVDYNTPNDLPTFIEAIYDTLTPVPGGSCGSCVSVPKFTIACTAPVPISPHSSRSAATSGSAGRTPKTIGSSPRTRT